MIKRDFGEGEAKKEVSYAKMPVLLPSSSVRVIPSAQKLVVCNAYVAFVVKSITKLALAEGSFVINYTFVCYIDPTGFTPRMLEQVATHMKFRLDDQAGQVFSFSLISIQFQGTPPKKRTFSVFSPW